ncbi:hypothetical protein ACFLTE_01460 [Bacteroidota bacterium]
MNSNRSKISIFSVLIVFVLLNMQCDKGEEFFFPYVEFYIQINIATDLYDLGGLDTKLFNGVDFGVGGIIIYKYFDKYYAFDAACTHEIPDEICSVEKNSTIIWECPCCESQYIFNAEYVYVKNEDDPANFPLKQYNASSDGVYVYVSN